ncbi:hypothetical protein ACLOJK_031491 [Asimina triloba]
MAGRRPLHLRYSCRSDEARLQLDSHVLFKNDLTRGGSKCACRQQRRKIRKVPPLVQSCWSRHFVFVHGASHGGWCWYKIHAALEAKGHTVSCLDLAGSGIDPEDPNKVGTFHNYTKPLLEFLSDLADDQKVILVGHSFGGMNVTYAMDKYVDKVEMAIYVNAAMKPEFGFISKVLPFKAKHTVDFSEFFTEYDMWFETFPYIIPSSIRLKREYQPKLLYNLSPMEDSTLAGTLLRPFPVTLPFFEVGEEVNQVPRVCIRGTGDTFFSDKSFESQVKLWPPTKVFEVGGDHCTFFSAPTQLRATKELQRGVDTTVLQVKTWALRTFAFRAQRRCLLLGARIPRTDDPRRRQDKATIDSHRVDLNSASELEIRSYILLKHKQHKLLAVLISTTTMESRRSPHFVFVHGASHGAWCWYKVRYLLEKAGYRVTCLDMASAGIHSSDPNTVLTFDEYNKPLTDFMAALPRDRKALGHSLGGLNVTDAMNKFVEKVQMAVYVNAAMFTMKDYEF